MRLHRQPIVIITNDLWSYGEELREIGAAAPQETGRWLSNSCENLHLPFRRMRSQQKFAAVHTSHCDRFNLERYLHSRRNFKSNPAVTFAEWRLRCSKSTCVFAGELRRVRIRLTIPHRSIQAAEAGLDQFAIHGSLGE